MFQPSTSLLQKVDGSAKLSQGQIQVVASVTGPIEAKLRQELPTSAALELVIRPATGVSLTREKLLEDKVRSVLQAVIIAEKYPRQLIQIVVQFLTCDQDFSASEDARNFTANELNAALNCCYFALVDAGVALSCSFASVSLSVDSESEKVIFDPSLDQLLGSKSHHVISYSIKDQQAENLLLVQSQGLFTETQLVNILDAAADKCQDLHNKYQRRAVLEKIERDFVWKLE